MQGILINNVKAVPWEAGQLKRIQINSFLGRRTNCKERLTMLKRVFGRRANCTDTVCIEWHLTQLKHGCALVAVKVLSLLKEFQVMFHWETGQLKGIQVDNVKAVHGKTGQLKGIQVNNVKADPWETG